MSTTAPAHLLLRIFTRVTGRPRLLVLSIALALGTAPDQSTAYDMNPIDVDCWGLSALCSVTDLTAEMKQPVHETMTLLAYDYYLKPEEAQGGKANSSAEDLRKSGVFRDLVLGSEWNDDPDALLRQNVVRAKQWYALFKDAQNQSKCAYDGTLPLCKDVKITDTPMMLYRSHFGDFQFLHAMASTPSETALETKAKMMEWARFVYTLSISGNNLSKETIDGPTISSFSNIASLLKRQGWTVGALFDPVPGGEWVGSFRIGSLGRYEPSGDPRTQVKYPTGTQASSIKHIALGSLLHMIQDSYSDAHVEREGGCNPLSRERGRIVSFRDYVFQISTDHAIADVHPKWLEHGDLAKHNPLWASAKMIQYSFRKVPWEGEVEQFLSNEVFPLAYPEKLPTTGDPECYLGTG
ncbi:hypothetical protein E3Z27_19420 [Pseudomonas mediterranea]|uniref:hypothetical protein n=1 Tax=Pseudomonas mediterranea TaxID=183795 RepID=UPI0006D8CC6A|nr:hypothetical protein [Pseudomonas mediterranea]QHA83680.1 hypothetical protein E3Z27_19420 [Pseudomonas mediterranea]